ncbi:MAG: hypothetical protein HRU20_18910 [Pseudomonadales bacterium]|nr:hypothetical protein [Pseudomonadales bacterium]
MLLIPETKIDANVKDPDENIHPPGVMRLWAEVSNTRGESREAHLDVQKVTHLP